MLMQYYFHSYGEATFSEGGLNMIKFESFVQTKGITWIKNLLDNTCYDWETILFGKVR